MTTTAPDPDTEIEELQVTAWLRVAKPRAQSPVGAGGCIASLSALIAEGVWIENHKNRRVDLMTMVGALLLLRDEGFENLIGATQKLTSEGADIPMFRVTVSAGWTDVAVEPWASALYRAGLAHDGVVVQGLDGLETRSGPRYYPPY